jgi:hypothetical protein
VVIAALSLLMLSCRPDQQPEITGSTPNASTSSTSSSTTSTPSACATNLYANYNPLNMEQCVNVCLRCEHGVMTTCSTSCTLKGAR